MFWKNAEYRLQEAQGEGSRVLKVSGSFADSGVYVIQARRAQSMRSEYTTRSTEDGRH